MDPSSYAAPGVFTRLTDEQVVLVRAVGADPRQLCAAAQGLLRLPGDAFGSDLSDERLAERNTRPASALLARALELDASPLDAPRSRERKVVGTCRHFAVLATAFLRAAGIPARARCGFASYFVPDKHVDHWITEHWSERDRRWIRIDAEILGTDVVERPDDLRPTDFLTGGEAWQLVQAGAHDAVDFGVDGTDHWGPGEVRGNLLRDLAALSGIEVLPWDEWGPMEASYREETDDAFDRLMDEVAAVCASGDPTALAAAYAPFAVPPELVR